MIINVKMSSRRTIPITDTQEMVAFASVTFILCLPPGTVVAYAITGVKLLGKKPMCRVLA
jgi:hypothetical protein